MRTRGYEIDPERRSLTVFLHDRPVMRVSLDELPQSMITLCALQGLKEKLLDSGTGLELHGDWLDALRATLKRLKAGHWFKLREPSKFPEVEAEAQKIARELEDNG